MALNNLNDLNDSNDLKNQVKQSNIIKVGFVAKGTKCESCVKIIKDQAMHIDGVKNVQFNYNTQKGYVTFDRTKTDIDAILDSIEEKGYECLIIDDNNMIKDTEIDSIKTRHSDEINKNININNKTDTTAKNRTNRTDKENSIGSTSYIRKIFAWTFGIMGLAIVLYFLFMLTDRIPLPDISQNMSYGLLFVVGLLTGFHCIAMCGGFVISYTANDSKEGKKPYLSHTMYASGKLISYTLIGALFGLIGSIVAFTPAIRGIAGVIAGIFLIIFGLNMLGIFPFLRRFRLRTPKFIAKFTGESRGNASPLVIGLLNGLMIACGPLQAIYIMAAGTGSVIEGAKLLFIFALGTLPVMIGFGFFASAVSAKFTQKILKASGIIVLILGLIMINNGLALSGSGLDAKSIATGIKAGSIESSVNTYANTGTDSKVLSNVAVQKDGYQEIRMDVTARGWEPDTFVLKKGVPVKWIINGKQITSCNRAIQVPKYNLKFDIKKGEQTIEFTPTESGIVSWSCWMGMIPGSFIIKDEVSADTKEEAARVQSEVNSVKASQPKGTGACGMAGGSGSCGCGMMG